MAKFAIALLAAFAFQAASAGVLMPYGAQDTSLGYSGYGYQGRMLGNYGYGYQGRTMGGYGYGLHGFHGSNLGDYGYGFSGKYQGFAKYGQDLQQFQIQFQTIIRDLYKTFETVSFDDVAVKQSFIYLIREYSQQLEYIVDMLNQYVSTNTGAEFYIFQEVAQNLKQYVVALQQFYIREYPTTQLSTEFYMYVQKIATEFERLFVGIEKSHGTYYDVVYKVLFQYFTATYHLYKRMHNIHLVSASGYNGPFTSQYYGDYQQQWGLPKYGQGYGYGKYFGQQLGMGKYYGQKYGTGYGSGLLGLGQYGKGYGYGYQHQSGYGYPYASYGSNWYSTPYTGIAAY